MKQGYAEISEKLSKEEEKKLQHIYCRMVEAINSGEIPIKLEKWPQNERRT